MRRRRSTALDKTLTEIEARVPAALAAQISEGKRALTAGEFENSRQALRDGAQDRTGQQRGHRGAGKVAAASGVVPTLADAENAENAKDLAKAQTLFADVLKRNPGNVAATEGLARVRRTMADNEFNADDGRRPRGAQCRPAGRSPHPPRKGAQRMRPDSAEVAAALQRAADTGSGRSLAELEQRAARLASEERWTEAQAIYDEALARDPSLQFAIDGRAAVAPRAELGKRLQALIDRPERLAEDTVRAEAERLLARAEGPAQPGAGDPLAGVAPGIVAAHLQPARDAGARIRQRHGSGHPARGLLRGLRTARGDLEARQIHGHRQTQRVSATCAARSPWRRASPNRPSSSAAWNRSELNRF